MRPDVCVEELSYFFDFFLGQKDGVPSSNVRVALDIASLLLRCMAKGASQACTSFFFVKRSHVPTSAIRTFAAHAFRTHLHLTEKSRICILDYPQLVQVATTMVATYWYCCLSVLVGYGFRHPASSPAIAGDKV